jgi:myo-inositol-1(or 4)-monophosphatase
LLLDRQLLELTASTFFFDKSIGTAIVCCGSKREAQGVTMTDLEDTYIRLVGCIVGSGMRIRERSGNIADIGKLKPYLTEEDVRIENELKNIVLELGPDHSFYAEEENDVFSTTSHVWPADPISATKTFLAGRPHYAITVAHLFEGQALFAVVFDPTEGPDGELYIARRDKGATRNGQPLLVPEYTDGPVILRVPPKYTKDEKQEANRRLAAFRPKNDNDYSVGLIHCLVAKGEFSGYVSIAKDSFPHFAGALILNEAGGIATNGYGSEDLSHNDRLFISAFTPKLHQSLLESSGEL